MSGFVNFSQIPIGKDFPAYIAGMKKVEREFVADFQKSSIFKKVDSAYFEKIVAWPGEETG